MKSIICLAALVTFGLSLGCGDDSDTNAGAGATGGGAAGGGGAGGSGGCTVDDSYDPEIDPANFGAVVDNPLFPLVVGTKFHYTEGDANVDIEVLDMPKTIAGVTVTTVHDVYSLQGEVLEDTLDWYAQDNDGTVWYFGEDTKELSGGMVVSTEGSWETGVDGGKPGMIVPANPTVGMKYRQEYYACHAEDMGEILELDASVTVTAGDYTGCLKTRDTTPLEPDVVEEKYYCPGVGNVLSVDLETMEREELVSIEMP